MASALDRLNSLIEDRLAPALERIAAALEGGSVGAVAGAAMSADRHNREAAAVLRAIQEGRWDQAEELLDQFERDFPDDPEIPSLKSQIASARDQTIIELRTRLEASRQVNDPETVIALHDDLAVLLRGEAKRELAQEIARWLILLIQRRMRTGTVQVDVVELAAKVAERFDSTTEGASIRASLPILRRSAGLCPRCGAPYAGLEDACPRCLTGAPGNAGETPPLLNPWAETDTPEESEEPEIESRDAWDELAE